ncbi:MAG: isoleucine--tRNA ligase [Nitrospirae bacterium]|nr:isoleucine--tRNA ligase [Nitrospirota bacterium]
MEKDYKDTLNLPRTDFPMKANLTRMEEVMLEKWKTTNLYNRLRETGKDRKKYILHDGPPYANGNIHIGHALNKILKDIIIRSKTMEGFDSPYTPGWDCHGLPIEHQVDKQLGPKKKGMSRHNIRKLCREYAENYVNIQREEFKRLGVSADWDYPYLTLAHSYEATIIREFGRFVENGGVYKRRKPVLWCMSCETALAEAEVEYADDTSPSVYVRFPHKSGIGDRIPALKDKDVSVVIWTTTPWTLPANLAVCLHPDFIYTAAELNGAILIMAKDLLPSFLSKTGNPEFATVAEFKGSMLDGVIFSHPFIDRDSIVVNGAYVTLEQGTGCVHTAPGHGEEDYETGLKYGLDIYSPVDSRGRFIDEVPFFAGMKVFEANKFIMEKMQELGVLLKEELISHSYPHCWRCKKPVIFRATEQWFISMETGGLRKKALKAIESVSWIPRWGRDRIHGMISVRPDWCISRQRTWGVPIIAFACKKCGHILLDKNIIDHVAGLVEDHGADIWFSAEVEKLLPGEVSCTQCGNKEWEQEMDILDVWFDSGVSHAAVLEKRPELSWPADLYLEGSDQHRGWFHSSLLESIGTRNKAPYRSVLTHGFVVDGSGRKMSKSAGNVIAPQEVINQYGAEILRLWVAAEDYREDIRISKDILVQLTEAYRRIRNTCRFLLGNLYDFDPQLNQVSLNELSEIDRWALHRLQKLTGRVKKAYTDFEFHIVFHALHNFCVVDMSSIYLDILKDRLYTFHKASKGRRAAQFAMYQILTSIVKLMAPVLSFTADEVWGYIAKISVQDQEIPKQVRGDMETESVHLSLFPEVNQAYINEELDTKWNRLLKVRGDVAKALEIARKDRLIGHSLEAHVDIFSDQELYTFLNDNSGELVSFFIVSSVTTHSSSPPPDIYQSSEINGLSIRISRAGGSKCSRCWNYSETVGQDTEHPAVCSRCAEALRS